MKLPSFALSKSAFLSSLFIPVNGATLDGWIEGQVNTRHAKGIRLHYQNETYVLNGESVFCLATKQPDGKTWYSYGGKLNALLSMRERDALATTIRGMIA